MKLGDLAAALRLAAPAETDVEVTGVTHRADWAGPGEVFVAIRGARADGHDYIDQAVERGAVGVLGKGRNR